MLPTIHKVDYYYYYYYCHYHHYHYHYYYKNPVFIIIIIIVIVIVIIILLLLLLVLVLSLLLFLLIQRHVTLFTGTCNENNVGIRDELMVIPDDAMTASSNNGSDFLPEFGRLQGMKAWCPNITDNSSYLEIDLGQKYVICGVEAQGLPGASVRTSFTLSFSDDGLTFTDFDSNQVMPYSQIFHLLPLISPTPPLSLTSLTQLYPA